MCGTAGDEWDDDRGTVLWRIRWKGNVLTVTKFVVRQLGELFFQVEFLVFVKVFLFVIIVSCDGPKSRPGNRAMSDGGLISYACKRHVSVWAKSKSG